MKCGTQEPTDKLGVIVLLAKQMKSQFEFVSHHRSFGSEHEESHESRSHNQL